MSSYKEWHYKATLHKDKVEKVHKDKVDEVDKVHKDKVDKAGRSVTWAAIKNRWHYKATLRTTTKEASRSQAGPC